MDTKIRELLYRSFDTQLAPRQSARLEAALRADQSLREERDRIAALRASAATTAADGFGPFFSERVMAHVTAQASSEASELPSALVASFKPIAIAVGIAVAALSPFAVPVLVESVTATEPTLTTMAQQTYAVELEDVLCQQE
jgi:hypothetical protein